MMSQPKIQVQRFKLKMRISMEKWIYISKIFSSSFLIFQIEKKISIFYVVDISSHVAFSCRIHNCTNGLVGSLG